MKSPIPPQECPGQMPVSYFGASYQDSQCIDDYLWDLDSGDGEYLSSGGDIPCPFCKPVEHIEYQLNDEEQIVCETCQSPLQHLHWAETHKPSVKLYGYCDKCECNKWGEIDFKESLDS